ncbi:hypothetical protein [Streptomyces nojiriensis]
MRYRIRRAEAASDRPFLFVAVHQTSWLALVARPAAVGGDEPEP